MGNWFVAESYQNFEQIGEAYKNENGKMYIKIKGTCPRCGGTGHYSYNYLDGTICYGCNGNGMVSQEVRAYTEKEYQAMQRAKVRTKERKAEQLEQKYEDILKNKHKYAIKFGFGEDDKIYVVYGDDTYSIKNKLKEMGGRFDPMLKWYFAEKVELPEGYSLCAFTFDELYELSKASCRFFIKENAAQLVEDRLKELMGPAAETKYYEGAVSDKIEVFAKLSKIGGFSGYYGYTYIYTFTSENYVFIWMTAKSLDNIGIGDTVTLKGTIKEFKEYNGINQTVLTRCKVAKIGD